MKVNWGAVLLAAIVDFGFGAFWFTTLAHPWRAGLGMSPEELQNWVNHPSPWPRLIAILCSIGMALVISWVMGMACKFSLLRGIVTGLMIGLVAALAMITEMAFEYRSSNFMFIAAAYPLIGCMLMGMVIGVWKPKGANLES
jgi:Protein of unknown function (DUF1761)